MFRIVYRFALAYKKGPHLYSLFTPIARRPTAAFRLSYNAYAQHTDGTARVLFEQVPATNAISAVGNVSCILH